LLRQDYRFANQFYAAVLSVETDKMKIPENINYKKVAIGSALTLIFGLTFCYGLFPVILRFMLIRVRIIY
jgi:hypothetical protein